MSIPNKLFLALSSLLLLSTGLCTGYFLGLSTKDKELEIPLEKASHTLHYCWIRFYMDTAAQEAATIVYGTVGAPGKTQVHTYFNSGGSVSNRYYCLTEIQDNEILKGDPDAKTVTYLNPEGETDKIIYQIYGGAKVAEGQSCLFFLNEHGHYLTPATVIKVSEEGTVSPYWDMLMDSSETYLFPEDTPIPIEDYIAAVRQYLD